MNTLEDIVRDLHSFDEDPVSWQEPTIYASEPWASHSVAIVSWSMPKGGLPDDAARLRLVRFVEVRSAIELMAEDYGPLTAVGRFDHLCALLISRVMDRASEKPRSRR